MRMFISILGMGILAAGIVGCQTNNTGTGPVEYVLDQCDRACLEGIVDRYLNAMAAHDPSQAPFAQNVKHTENTAILPFSEGLWFTSTGLGDYRFYIADPQAGQIAYVGIVKESDKTSHFTVRLKVENQQIVEVETLVVRNLEEGQLRYLTIPPPAFSEALVPEEQSSREELIKISSLYFDGIEQLSNNVAPWDPDCYRIENGMWTAGLRLPDAITANLPEPKSPPPGSGEGGPPIFRRSACSDGFDSGGFGYITSIQPRRVAVVDEERGVTWGLYRFNHRGVRTLTMKDGSARPSPFADEPNSMPIAEIFKIKNGKIRDIMALMVTVPYGASTGWE